MRLVTKAEFARLAGVSPAAVGQACDRKLGRAVVDGKIDLDHRAAHIYLAGRDEDPTGTADGGKDRPKTRAAPRPTAPTGPELDADPEQFLDRTLREITDKFHGFHGFDGWLDARKTIADIREKDLKNAERDGQLIPREGVRVHVFGAIDATFERLIRDVPRNAAVRAMTLTRSGANSEEVERAIREQISKVLAPLKQKASRALRGATVEPDPGASGVAGAAVGQPDGYTEDAETV